MRYAGATRTSRPVAFITIGATARRILEASGALRDYPTHDGRRQARDLHVDTDASGPDGAAGVVAPVPDRAAVEACRARRPDLEAFMRPDHEYRRSATGATSIPQAFLAGASEYARIYRRVQGMLHGLVRTAGTTAGTTTVVRVYVVAWTGGATGGGLLPQVLQAGQRLKRDMAEYGIELDRYLLLTRPSLMDGRHTDMLVRSTAVLTALEAASRFGLEVADGQRLEAPVCEYAFVLGRGRGLPAALPAQVHEAGAVLRLLADPGPLGTTVRGRLWEQRPPAPHDEEARIFKTIGLTSMVLDREAVIDLLTDLALALADAPGGA